MCEYLFSVDVLLKSAVSTSTQDAIIIPQPAHVDSPLLSLEFWSITYFFDSTPSLCASEALLEQCILSHVRLHLLSKVVAAQYQSFATLCGSDTRISLIWVEPSMQS